MVSLPRVCLSIERLHSHLHEGGIHSRRSVGCGSGRFEGFRSFVPLAIGSRFRISRLVVGDAPSFQSMGCRAAAKFREPSNNQPCTLQDAESFSDSTVCNDRRTEKYLGQSRKVSCGERHSRVSRSSPGPPGLLSRPNTRFLSKFNLQWSQKLMDRRIVLHSPVQVHECGL